MTFTPAPAVPSRSGSPTTFNADADAFIAWWADFATNIGPLADAASSLYGAINYAGVWSAIAFTQGKTVYHTPTGQLYLALTATLSTDVPGVATTKWYPIYEKVKTLKSQALTGLGVVDVSLPAGYYAFDFIADNFSFATDTLMLGVAFSTNGTTYGSPVGLQASAQNNGTAATLVGTLWRPGAGPGFIESKGGTAAAGQSNTGLTTALFARFGPIAAGVFSGAFDLGNLTVIGTRA